MVYKWFIKWFVFQRPYKEFLITFFRHSKKKKKNTVIMFFEVLHKVHPVTYSESCQTSKMERFAKIVTGSVNNMVLDTPLPL